MVQLRFATPDDAGFLFRVYRETHAGMFESLGSEVCEMLLQQQSSLRECQYDEQYVHLERFIIMCHGNPIGCLYLNKGDDEWVLVNIAVLPDRQHAGAGTQVLKKVLAGAGEVRSTVRLHVEQSNRAFLWYRKYGFKETGMKEPYIEMLFNPSL